jgi:hypothetical protein
VAKRGRPVGGGWNAEVKPGDTALGDFAADLGNLLGTVQNRASSWMEQRKAITEQLTRIRDTANDYLQQLSGAGATAVTAFQRARRGRPPKSAAPKAAPPAASPASGGGAKKGGRRKGFKMSASARKRIGEAQRARWAKLRRQGKGGGTDVGNG